MKKPPLNLSRRLTQKRWRRTLKLSILAILGFMVISLLFNFTIRLPHNQSEPVDGILVLGGSIRREIYAAQLANRNPEIPILISKGSKEPCIWYLFQQHNAKFKGVWLEECANSTFDNFFFSVPILRRWGVHKVKVITSPSHLPRAEWLANIHLGSQGIAVEVDAVREWGIPGNQESRRKTILDVTRSLIWAFFSQLIQPPCFSVTELSSVNLPPSEKQGADCESQGRMKMY